MRNIKDKRMKKTVYIISLALSLFLFVQILESWTTVRLSWTSGDSRYPAVAVDSSENIHVVWQDDSSANKEIYYKKGSSGGSSWTFQRLTWTSGDSSYPSIAVDSNNHIFVVWEDASPGNIEIYFKKSTNGGTSWTTKRLSWNSGYSKYPCIAVDSSDNIFLVWHDSSQGNNEIFFKKSTDGGSSWMTKRITWNSGISDQASVAAHSSGNIYVVWREHTPGNAEVYFQRSTNGGTSWTTKRLTWNAGMSLRPDIALDSNGYIHVTWYDTSQGDYEIFYKKSTDNGTSWITKRLTWNPSFSQGPKIATDSSNAVHVVWQDYSPSNWNAFYKMSTDGGLNWSQQRISWSDGVSVEPEITISPSEKIYIVWTDYSPGNPEIYFKKNY
jgi:hypothetical protein